MTIRPTLLMELSKKRLEIISALRHAGEAMIHLEESGDYKINNKSDQTPVTCADKISDSIIRKMLVRVYPDIPVISEEHSPSGLADINPFSFWLLDPLDGTKEFIKGNGEYCISLALIENKRPVEAYIYSPVDDKFRIAVKGMGAYRIVNDSLVKLPASDSREKESLLLLRSRSHHGKEEIDWLARASEHEEIESYEQGSAIKFCRIAEGNADLYVKKGRIFGWDIAAGDLILKESGGGIISFDTGKELYYNSGDLTMPHFLAYGSRINNPEHYL
jgi:3'(2'), 5'-bisphosphate nucleotidase